MRKYWTGIFSRFTKFLLVFAYVLVSPFTLFGYDSMPGPSVYIKRGEGNARTRIHPPQQFLNVSRLRTSTFEVSFTGFPYDAQMAFQYSLDIWSTLISSSVPIHINAIWEPLDPETLGFANASLILRDFPGAPFPNTYYPISLAEKLSGSELNSPGFAEINVHINSTTNWYFGTDGNTPDASYDLVSISLHEICHGLGFLGSMNVSNGYGSWGINGSSIIYDQFAVDAELVQLINTSIYANPSYELANTLMGEEIYWSGEYGLIGNDFTQIELYAPQAWDPGSSFSHLDENTYYSGNPNSLMTPFIDGAEAVHDPGTLTLGILNDLGWTVEYPDYHGRMLDSLALISLYNHTNGPNWYNNTNWLSNSGIDTWHGVTISENRVSRISLSGNNLSGYIPPEIKNLTKVTLLNFMGNYLAGTIPNEIQFMYNLTDLNLNSNSITGNIPVGLCFAHNLRNLAMPGNNLTGTIPPEIGFLSNLSTLFLSQCEFSGTLPSELWTLPDLSSLILNGNSFSGEISSVLELAVIPVTLILSDNLFTGEIGPEIGNLSQLRNLSIGNSNITGVIPPEIGNLHELVELRIINSGITGSIPSEIGNLNNLTTLYINNNDLTGQIPETFINLELLEVLDLSNNNIEGTIPAVLADITSLRALNLSENRLSGNIPLQFENAGSLHGFNVSQNELTGDVPLLNISTTGGLYLNNNKFINIPDLSYLSPLYYFRIEHNMLTFEDLEPNIGIAYNESYTPQDSVGTFLDTTIELGSTLILELFVGGAANQYHWMLNGNVLPDENTEQLVLSNIQYNQAGTYACEITNSLVTELTLHSRPMHVEVVHTNSPPVWFQEIPDTLIMTEDSIVTYLLYASDVDGDVLYYDAGSSDPSNVSAVYLDSVITITPTENWYGSAEIFAHVSDNDTTISNSFDLIVNPENDAPQGFMLLSPPDESNFTAYSDTIISFIWEAAIDVEEDLIEYTLSFHSDSYDSIIESINSTHLEVDVTGFVRNTPILWSVLASDVAASTTAIDTFMIQIGHMVNLNEMSNVPSSLMLEQNYPNPCNPSTTISYALPEDSNVSLVIYDVRGQVVQTIASEYQPAGWYDVTWNGEAVDGHTISTGIYFARLVAGDYSQVIKMLYLK